MGDTLTPLQKLENGQSITSANGKYKLTLQADGNLVLTDGDTGVWSTKTNGQNVVRAEVQEDGNFVAYTADKPVWHTDTAGKPNVHLILQDDRNLVLYSNDTPVWQSNTHVDAPAPEETKPEPEPTPAPAPAPAAPPPPPAARHYTVESGDTLWAIAERFYGDGNAYGRIASANGIDNPDLINVGQVLTIP